MYNRSAFDLKNVNEMIESYEAQNEKLFDVSQTNKYESEQLLGKIGKQTEINHTLDSEYQIAQNNQRHTEESIGTVEENIRSLEKSLEEEGAERQKKIEKAEALKGVLATLKEEHEKGIAEQTRLRGEADRLLSLSEEALVDLRAFEKDATDVRVRLSVIENAKNSDGDKNSTILEEIRKYDALALSYQKQMDTCKTTLDEYETAISSLDATIADLAQKRAELYENRKDNEDKLSAARLTRDSLSQRIETIRTMEEQLEGYSNSVRYVMKAYHDGKITTRSGKACGKIYGPLSKVISVGDEYVVAIETALAANLQHIVVEDEETAKAAMYALKHAEAGRATFFPITSMFGHGATNEMAESRKYGGFISFANELVSCEAKFKEIVSSLLGRTVVFDNVENATKMAKALHYRVQVVTLDGQQIRVGGSFTGGSVRAGGGILSRASEIKHLEKKLAEADKLLGACIEAQKTLEHEIVDAEEESSSYEDKRRLYEVMKTSEVTRAEQLRAKFDANETLSGKLRADYGDVIEQNRRYEEEAETLLAKEKELSTRIAEITELREQKDVERNETLEKCESLSLTLTELYIKISETGKDIETEQTFISSIDERISSYTEGIQTQKQRIETCRIQIAEFEETQKENRRLFAEGEKQLEELNRRRAQLESDSFAFEKKLADMNAKIREKRAEQENVFREYTKNENKLTSLKSEQDKLSTKMWDDYEMTRAEAVALGYPPITKLTRAATAAKQIDCRNKLRAIGNVDLDAVNKYKEVKERYDRMDRQIKDLEASRSDLLKIIDRLEVEMKAAFTDSFNRINENFGRVFSELFGGGTAEIVLTEPENVLTSGIEIKAAPPGKIIKNLMQLSGGEQSFVAIALLFAILNVNPPPFCIMDEIEAALDEVNVARLAEYIKRYSNSTQFVMITHRRGTMEAANMLYGVTMPEHGISKVLALDVADISKKKGDDWDGIFG